MNTVYFEICKSSPEDVEYMRVPPIEVFAIGSGFSRHVGYFATVEEAKNACKDSGHRYKVNLS